MVRLSLPPRARPRNFQLAWVRPSSGCYPAFVLARGRSRGFASAGPDRNARFGLGFPPAPRQRRLATPGPASRRVIMQKARGQACPFGRSPPTACRRGVSGSLSSPPGVLPIVRSRYSTLSVAGEYLALRDGPRGFGPTSTCWVLLRIPPGRSGTRVRGSHPVSPAIPRRSAPPPGPSGGPTTPGGRPPGLGSPAFARRY